MYLKYDNLEKCQADLDLIYVEMIRERLLETDGTMLNILTGIKEIPNDITSDKYPIFGQSKGVINKINGYTTAYALPQQDIHSNWYFRKPEFEFEHNGIEVETIEIQNTEI